MENLKINEKNVQFKKRGNSEKMKEESEQKQVIKKLKNLTIDEEFL